MEGNFFNARGMYPEAIGSYLKAQGYPEARVYADLGLGSVYSALDEGPVALLRFDAAAAALREAPEAPYPELQYRIHYNTGVVRFREGDYEGASRSFRSALEADGSRIEAKHNLELSLLSLAHRKNTEADQAAAAGGERGERHAPLFEYLRQKERDLWQKRERWESRELIEDAPYSGPDY
jgi:Ca-activated chloride channel family protein